NTPRVRRTAVVAAWALAAAAVVVGAVSWVNWRNSQRANLTDKSNSPVANPGTADQNAAPDSPTLMEDNELSDFTFLPGVLPTDTDDATILEVRIQRGALGALGLPVNEDRAAEWIQVELLGFGGMRQGKVVTGAQFSAIAVSEPTQTLADGNHLSRNTQSNVFCDSQGRIRREITFAGFGPMAAQSKSFVVINDPVAGTTFLLHPDQKTAEKMGKPFARMKGAMQDKIEARQQKEIANGNLKKEDVGTQPVAGGIAP